MLERIPSDLDTRESAIIYSALAPAAMELAELYLQLNLYTDEMFGNTASREALLRHGAERGIFPYPATKATWRMVSAPVTLEVPIGFVFSRGALNYRVTSKQSSGEYQVVCDTAGEVGNHSSGDLLTNEYLPGLETAKLTELLIPGENEEDTESLRKRYIDSLRPQGFGGNKKDYREKTNAIPGVGETKVTPVWQGGGTVLLTIVDAAFQPATNVLLHTVQEIIDPEQNQGKGLGTAPIGHVVTVQTVTQQVVNVATTVVYEAGHSAETRGESIRESINAYLLELCGQWGDKPLVVRISQMETRILELDGVLDIFDTTLNGSNRNLLLLEYEIPKAGEIGLG